ncbi:MAG: hypothetical protein KJ666_15535 [Bacteroidetes bacterium]|nr:hypothetical protein [Bacteroidota bacterium]
MDSQKQRVICLPRPAYLSLYVWWAGPPASLIQDWRADLSGSERVSVS